MCLLLRCGTQFKLHSPLLKSGAFNVRGVCLPLLSAGLSSGFAQCQSLFPKLSPGIPSSCVQVGSLSLKGTAKATRRFAVMLPGVEVRVRPQGNLAPRTKCRPCSWLPADVLLAGLLLHSSSSQLHSGKI